MAGGFTQSLCLLLFLSYVSVDSVRYDPNWGSLDSRPLPEWYDKVKIGVFINWGVYSVPAYGSEWFWWNWQGRKLENYIQFMQTNYPLDFTYPDFAPLLHARQFDANQWADLFQHSGARYIVHSTKHHEGFTMWPSKNSWNWNAMDVGPHRDIIGELATAVRNRTSIFFGLYHSLFEWFNPLYLADKANKFQTQNFVKEKTMPELYEIVNMYKPDLIWSDGDWEAPDTYWNSTEFLAWLYNDSPVKDSVLTNDRWGSGDTCKHGGFLTCSDRYNPGVLQKRKWENAMTLDKKSWGYRREMELSDVLTMKELIETMAKTVSCGGNLLVNIAPTAGGTIPPIYQERLRQMGAWLNVYGQGIYNTVPWRFQNDSQTPGVWYTSQKVSTQTVVYAIVLKWPSSGYLYLKDPVPGSSDECRVNLIGYGNSLKWNPGLTGGVNITVSDIPNDKIPFDWGSVFSLYGLRNE